MNYLLNQHKSGGIGDGVLDAPIFFHPLNYWDISQQCTLKINWHQSYYNHGIATSERAVEGASPYNSEITASPEHGRTLFAPTDVCGVIKGCEINNNAKCQGGGLSRAPAPTDR